MQLARPIGFSLSKPLLERLDAIARSEGLSRSSVARTFIVEGLAQFERRKGATGPFMAAEVTLSRQWRPRVRLECVASAPSPHVREE
jgi:metal-responsive CopG/Arc/MetJ family transcriptional regulator